MSNLLQQGIFNTSEFAEQLISPYDSTFYVEPDNSVWIRIFHHNNPASVRFATTDNFAENFYIDSDRWSAMPMCNKITNGKYELMVKSKLASTSAINKYRWIQTKNPLTATFAEVSSAKVTKITTSGYSSYNWGGLYAIKSDKTYFCANDGTEGHWWGAIGTYVLYQSGTPGWINIVTTGCQDVYLRIDNQTSDIKSISDYGIMMNNFIEW